MLEENNTESKIPILAEVGDEVPDNAKSTGVITVQPQKMRTEEEKKVTSNKSNTPLPSSDVNDCVSCLSWCQPFCDLCMSFLPWCLSGCDGGCAECLNGFLECLTECLPMCGECCIGFLECCK